METTGQESDERADEAREPRTIKRYANRKLYDTRESRYVTLQQIAGFVRAGEEVVIIDNTTKEDLTHVTLAQIIYEEEKKRTEGAASSRTLRSLIQQSGEKLMTTLRTGPVGKLIARNEEGRPETPAAPAPEPKKRSFFATSKEALDELQRLADDRMRGVLGYAIDHVHSLQAEVARLQARIEELETRLVALQKRREDEPDE